MTRRVYTDRSRVQEFQHCNRKRYLAYHAEGIGISSATTPLPLAVGKAVHAGLAELLRYGVTPDPHHGRHVEDKAVSVALAQFATDTIELDVTESSAVPKDGAESDPALSALVGKGKSDFDRYLAAEQAALVEGQVRAYARRRLRPLLEQFEVLEVEREGSWHLTEIPGSTEIYTERDETQIWFMSRPDALLRERSTNQLYLLSFKTAASWDVRKARDAEHDMQGLSEGVEVERRLAEWWNRITQQMHDPNHKGEWEMIKKAYGISDAMYDFLSLLPAPPRIHAIRYEYLLKGDRWKDKDLTARFGFEARAQRSSLIRGYLNAGMAAGDEQWCHSWDYLKDGGTGETSKLNYRAWRSEPVWTHMAIARWIDMLESATMTVAESSGELGYSCDAQSVGYTATHPLDDVFVPPIVIYRSDDDLRDWIEQTESQERRVAESLVQVEAAGDEDSRRSLLNVHFGQSRRACSYPTECQFVPVCYGGEDIRRDPLGSGRYKRRVANHPQEVRDAKV